MPIKVCCIYSLQSFFYLFTMPWCTKCNPHFSYECWFLLALSLFLQAWIKKESEHSSSGKMASPLKIYRLYSMRSVGYIKYHDVLATFDFFFI